MSLLHVRRTLTLVCPFNGNSSVVKANVAKNQSTLLAPGTVNAEITLLASVVVPPGCL
jgi:hypothetical protein